jgi:hypothetical protein
MNWIRKLYDAIRGKGPEREPFTLKHIKKHPYYSHEAGGRVTADEDARLLGIGAMTEFPVETYFVDERAEAPYAGLEQEAEDES